MLRTAIVLNVLLSIAAVVFAIFIQQMSGAMIRHSHFQFFQAVSDEDRRHIFAQAAAVMWIAIVPLLVSNMAWIAIGCIAMMRKSPVSTAIQSNEWNRKKGTFYFTNKVECPLVGGSENHISKRFEKVAIAATV